MEIIFHNVHRFTCCFAFSLLPIVLNLCTRRCPLHCSPLHITLYSYVYDAVLTVKLLHFTKQYMCKYTYDLPEHKLTSRNYFTRINLLCRFCVLVSVSSHTHRHTFWLLINTSIGTTRVLLWFFIPPNGIQHSIIK